MGKIVKYCASCDESFAEKFAFCPNCGKGMQAFEMNPLAAKEVVAERTGVGASNGNGSYKAEAIASIQPETVAKIEPVKIIEPAVIVQSEGAPAAQVKSETTADEAKVVETPKPIAPVKEPVAPVKEAKVFAATAAPNGSGHKTQTTNDGYRTVESGGSKRAGGFNVTVIEEKNVKQRNLLLLASLLFMMTLAAGGFVYSIFNSNLSIAAIGDESGLAMPVDDVVPVEEIETPKPKLDKNAGGGGGGGGRKDEAPVSKGELPPQFKDKPLLTPSKEDISVTNPAIRVMRATQGPDDIIPKNRSATNGDPNSTNTNPSNGHSLGDSGMGLNGKGGIGTNGENGYGANGKGGRGISTGSQYGNENGEGGRVATPPPPPAPSAPKPVGVTEKVKILSKPRASYTDTARQNQVTGTVRLRVTFTASGQVGSVATVSGLPYGLTEQAIAAAKGIKFEPAKVNGVPKASTSIVEYSFTIY